MGKAIKTHLYYLKPDLFTKLTLAANSSALSLSAFFSLPFAYALNSLNCLFLKYASFFSNRSFCILLPFKALNIFVFL